MYLSQLRLDPRHGLVRHDLANFYELHRTLSNAYLFQRDGKRSELLFRVEPNRSGETVVLVQSLRPPDWQRLPTGYVSQVCDAKLIADIVFRVGQRLRFRLRANPSKRLRARSMAADGRPIDSHWVAKRVGLVRADEQEAWLSRKGRAGGFRLVSVQLVPEGLPRARKNGTDMSFVAVRFDGLLEVTDADVFRNTILSGIGSGKAFGFGLISVAPAR